MKRIFCLILLLCVSAAFGGKESRIVKDVNSSSYLLTLAPDDVPAEIRIGEQEKFTTSFRASKWNNECWLNINHPDIVTVEKEQIVEGKLELVLGNNTHRYYITEDGKLEYEIEFAAKPQSNIVELSLDFPDGLVFFYQDTLENEYKIDPLWYKNLEDYLADHNRPDDVVGSYAVYWAPGAKVKKNNQYKTGKFCHIYRPKLIDANNKTAWCELNITEKILKITMPQEFLDSAIYPIRLDPTIGYEGEGGSAQGWTDMMAICRSACGEDGTCNPGTFYVYGEKSPDIEALGCVYHDNSGTAAGQAKLSSSEGELTMPDGLGWANAAITVAGGFSNGTDYWVGILCNAAAIRWDAATPGYEDMEYVARTYEDGLPANFDAGPSSVAREQSCYIDYTAAGGQVIIINASAGYGFGGLGLILVLAIIRKLRR